MNKTLLKVGVSIALFGATQAFAAGTTAGTNITNTATASYTSGGTPSTTSSNPTSIPVQEILNSTLTTNDASYVTVSPGQNQVALSYKLTNTGNGTEPFTLSANNTVTGSAFNPTNTKIYLDSQGTGVFDPTKDTLYTAGSNDPKLAPDASVTVFVVSDVPSSATNGQNGLVQLTDVANLQKSTGSIQAAGYTYQHQGNNGVDAVVGTTQATGTAQDGYTVAAVLTTLQKTFSVADPFGGTESIPGSTITYTLTFTATGSGSLTAAKITDAVPTNTTYVPSSITLNGTPVTDSSTDADAGGFVNGNTVSVSVGTGFTNSTSGGTVTVATGTPAVNTVTFKVKIN